MRAEHNPSAWRISAVAIVVCAACAAAPADYASDRQAALALVYAKQHKQALAAFLKMSETAQNDYQRSDAFERAAMCAQQLQRTDEALQLAARIPSLPHARTVRMRIMAEQKRWQDIVNEFRGDQIAFWPRSAAWEAFHIRGLAYRRLNDLTAARRDLAEAARRSDRSQVFFDLAGVCVALKRDVEAMDAYLNVQRALPNPSGWQFYTAVISRANILLRNGIHEYALEELDKAGNVRGYWLVKTLRTRAAILAAMGRKAEAQDVYRAALKTDGVRDAQKRAIEAALEQLQKQE